MSSKYFLISFLVFLNLSCSENREPFTEIDFVKEYPGAGERYVLFTPILKNNSSIIVGESVGADYGVLHFRDCDGDNINEAIVESGGNFFGEYSAAVRHVYKFSKDVSGIPHAKLISTEHLPEKDPEWVRENKGFTGGRYCEK